MKGANYNNQMFKQVQELIEECSKIKNDMKALKKQHSEEMQNLEGRIEILEKENTILRVENQKLREYNDRLKKIINNDSNNSSNPPSSDIKPNKKIFNSREKGNNKIGGQKGHKPYILSKTYVEEKIEIENLEVLIMVEVIEQNYSENKKLYSEIEESLRKK